MGENLRFNFNNPAGAVKPVNWPGLRRKIRVGRLPFVSSGLMQERAAALLMAYRAKINPEGRPLKGLYGASAADIGSVLLATDADEVYMMDLRQVKVEEMRRALGANVRIGGVKGEQMRKALERKTKESYWNENDFMSNAEDLIAFELKALGIDRSAVKIGINIDRNVIIRFWWAYPGEAPRQRIFTYLFADVTKPDGPPPCPHVLKKLLQPRGMDFYYQRASTGLMLHMEEYMNVMSEAADKFVLVSPTVATISDLGMKKRLADIMGKRFTLDEEVNDAYAKYFENPANWKERQHPYSWYMEYWKRTGG